MLEALRKDQGVGDAGRHFIVWCSFAVLGALMMIFAAAWLGRVV
jgi:hypothetical protein